MVTRIKNGKILVNGVFAETDVYFADGRISAIGGGLNYDAQIDACGNYVTAGFVDLHCHGGGGCDFNDGTADAVRTSALTHLSHGTTSLFPTVTSADIPSTIRAIEAINEAADGLPSLLGIHLEGPYLSPAQTGAQNGSALKAPKKEEYLTILYGYDIARWDYAPDVDTDFEFLEALLERGVVPSAAHTDATCAQMEEAARRGCRLITHMYSCTSTVRREKGFRIAGVLEAAYLTDEISAELIADGCHLPNELIRLAYKLKGADRLALVTDAMRAAGTDTTGECEIGGVRCVVEDGVAKLLDRSAFAGSIATADRLARTALSAGIPLEDTVKMMTETPASIMGLKNKGKIELGYDADLVIFDKDVNIKTVILKGKTVMGGK